MLETVRSVQTNYTFLAAQQQQDRELQRFIATNDDEMVWFGNPKEMDMHFLLSSSVRSLSRVLDKVMKVEAGKQLTVTAIALKRYQLKHANYPAALNSLIPEFLPALPLDPVDGKPLRYHLGSDKTLLLYSIGADGLDDNGDPSPSNPNSKLLYWQYGRDWVWPQPANPK